MINGFGIYTQSDGTKYVGNYVDGIRNGFGIHTQPNGTKYEGNYLNGILSG